MKKLINDPTTVVREMCAGIVLAVLSTKKS